MKKVFCIICWAGFLIGSAQEVLTQDLLEKYTYRFSLNADHEFEGEGKEKWTEWTIGNQFIGIAEVHNSAQLGAFTSALLKLLHEQDFNHLVMEMGPNTAKILEENTKPASLTTENIKSLNRKYGKKGLSRTPFIFADKIEDAQFLQTAADLGYSFWGIDQEFARSYEMLIDHLYSGFETKTADFEKDYLNAKTELQTLIHKDKHKGQPVFGWYIWSEPIDIFLRHFKDEESLKVIQDIKTSWDIYNNSATGKGSNQQRADYMKKNFEQILHENGSGTKALIKLGGVHLTHHLSPFGVDDMGKYLTEKADQNNTGFLSIRHLIPYRNGKSNVGKSSWQDVSQLLELGRKDQWTVIDLRPIRAMLDRGEITASKNLLYELRSYDLVLLTPDDQYPKVNY